MSCRRSQHRSTVRLTRCAPLCPTIEHLASGKVRELYRIDDDHLLFVASDRISAFDYILDNQIPDKGRILTAMSVFFFDYAQAPNHLAGPPDDPRIPDEVLGRALVVRKLDMIPVECVARGYLTGSGLLDYQKTGEVSGIALPPGLTEASKFDTPLFTPATKAELGEHDENISFADVIDMVGAVRANQLRDLTLQTYVRAADHALTKGIIIADTKFEFGVDAARQPGAGRRGLHPGLVAVLGRRHLSGGRRAAQLRQAVRPQLAD